MSETEVVETKTMLIQRDSAGFANSNGDLVQYLASLNQEQYAEVVSKVPVSDEHKYETGWALFQHKIPMWLFIITCLWLTVMAFQHNLSLIPMLGLVSCFYMMAQIPAKSWMGFFIWLLIGLAIYFSYGYKNSKLSKTKTA